MNDYWFPRAKFVDEKGIAGQMQHVGNELQEFENELIVQNWPAAMIELLDMRHSCETALRIMQEKYGAPAIEFYAVYTCELSVDRYVWFLRSRYMSALLSALNDHAPVVVGHLLNLMLAIDTQLMLLVDQTGFVRDDFVGRVIQKNDLRGYYGQA